MVNPWQYKPWWCQPWSILLTGLGLVAAAWQLGHQLWLTGLVALPISLWMGYFLLVWPRLMQPYLTQAAAQVSDTQTPDLDQSPPQQPSK
jgi:cytochrome bd-type quinol oxidase subunit 2